MASHNFLRTDLPFPPELVHEIVNLLPASTDLGNIALVSRTLRDVVQSIILRRISIEIDEDSHVPFLDAVIAAPNRIGAYVRKYSFHARGASGKSVDKVARALRVMTNLKHFKYTDTYWHPDSLPIIQGWQIRLTSLHWNVHPRGNNFEDPLFKILLSAQPQIKHLVIESLGEITDDIRAMAIGLCPHLESLGGPRSVMELFFKGREIKYLKWYPDKGQSKGQVCNEDKFKDEFEQLEYLEYSPSRGRVPGDEVGIQLPSIAKYLKNVRVLTVDIRRVNRGEYYDSGARWPRDVYKDLTNLETLQLKMQPRTGDRNPKKDRKALSSIFSHCTSLKRVYAELFEDQIYMKYTNEAVDGIEFALKAEYAYANEVLLWDNYATRGQT